MPDSVTIVFETQEGERFEVAAEPGASLMETAIRNNVPGIEAECGGSMSCATCHVYCGSAFEAAGEPDEMEREMLEMAAAEARPDSRLSCQVKVSAALEGAVIELPETQI